MKMGSYLIDLGNSNDGPIGMVLRVNAASKADAVEVARQTLRLVSGDCGEIALHVPTEVKEAAEYINVYLNPNVITEKDVGDDDSQETHE
jgi:hypothetical protein